MDDDRPPGDVDYSTEELEALAVLFTAAKVWDLASHLACWA